MRNRTKTRLGERGQVLPLTALSMVMLLALSALAVDIGTARHVQRLAQNRADVAAIAGANELSYSTSKANITSIAVHDAQYTDSDSGPAGNVTIHYPPIDGPNAGNKYAVEAVVTDSSVSYFGGIVGISSYPVMAKSVAVGAPSLPCLIATNPKPFYNPASFTINAKAGLTVPDCDVESDGDLLINGAGAGDNPKTFIDSSSLSYAGALQNPQAGGFATTTQGYVGPQPIAHFPDPCKTNAVCNTFPPFPGCGPAITGNVSGGRTITPGCYGGINTWSGATNKYGPGTLTFQSGTYYIKGAVDTYNATVTATGPVTIYATGYVHFQSTTVNFPSAITGKPLIWTSFVGADAFDMNASLHPSKPNSATFGGMIYAPGGVVTLTAGTYKFLSIVGGNIFIDTGFGAVKMSQSTATPQATSLSE